MPLVKNCALFEEFFNEEDRKTIERIEKEVQQGGKKRIEFKTKRIFDYMRRKYNFVVEGLKNAERLEYTCKMTPKYEDFFEE